MKANLWVKKGTVSIFVGGDPSKGGAPVVTLEMKDPQIVYDEATNKVTITETK